MRGGYGKELMKSAQRDTKMMALSPIVYRLSGLIRSREVRNCDLKRCMYTRKEIFRASSRFRRLASENDSYMRSDTQSRANDTQCLKRSNRCRARCERHHRELIENHRRAQQAMIQLSTSHCENHINVVILRLEWYKVLFLHDFLLITISLYCILYHNH